MSMELVPAAQVHGPLLASLHRICFAQPWDAAAMADLLACPGTGGVIASGRDGPAGLVLWRVAADEAEILTLAVLPPWRRAGLGRRLLAAAAAAVRAAGAATLFLEVACGNTAGQALYRAAGFREVGRRKGYYDGGGDALVMRLDL